MSNAANVLAAIGADELDYSLTTAGDVSGSFLDQMDLALGSGNMHLVTLDTSTPGMKSGMITISSSSQAVQNGLVSIPVSYQVLSLLLTGDYNQNGEVDAADYVLWRDTFGQNIASGTGADGDGDGTIDDEDYSVWRSHFGQSASESFAAASDIAVPEPGTRLVVIPGRLSGATGGRYTETMDPQELISLARQVVSGAISPDQFARDATHLLQPMSEVSSPATASLPSATVDLDRRRRCGYPEVVFGPGKTLDQLREIVATLVAHGERVLATRIDAAQAAGLLEAFPDGRYNAVARTFRRHTASNASGPRRRNFRRYRRLAGCRGGPRNARLDGRAHHDDSRRRRRGARTGWPSG